MDSALEEDLESEKRISEIDAMYEREAYKVIHSFIDIYNLGDDYQITPFTLGCITSFLMEWNFYNVTLPEGVWGKVIKMYMEIIEIDWKFLEEVHTKMCRTH